MPKSPQRRSVISSLNTPSSNSSNKVPSSSESRKLSDQNSVTNSEEMSPPQSQCTLGKRLHRDEEVKESFKGKGQGFKAQDANLSNKENINHEFHLAKVSHSVNPTKTKPIREKTFTHQDQVKENDGTDL
jgi:hypothetical protein